MTKPLWEWVGSSGGPLIVPPTEIARHWRGIDPPPDAQVPEGWQWGDPGDPVCDYDRACGVDGYVGTLDVGPGQAIILGDMPMMTAFLPQPDGGLFVRWGYANSVDEVRRAISAVTEDLWQHTDHEFQVEGGPLLMFDSANPGTAPPEGCYAEDAEHIEVWLMEVNLSAGRYRIEWADFKPDEKTWLILVRLGREAP